ncbi:MAG: hypothetical protein WCC63_07690 [Candidatus Bathyarchaeia archaeon]
MRTPRHLTSALLLPLSFSGLILIAALTSLPPKMQDDAWRKPLVGTVFSVVCTLGILAGIFPSKCSGTFHFRTRRQRTLAQEPDKLPKEAPDFRGHHPNCGNFSAHVFQAGRRFFCAGCVGLIFGAALSLLGAAGYFFLHSSFAPDYFLVFWAGFVGVSCGLLQYHLFDWGGSSVHLLVNTFFVLGVFMLLAGVDALAQSVVIDMYVIVLSVFWLYARILLSQLHHRGICAACGMEQCGYH